MNKQVVKTCLLLTPLLFSQQSFAEEITASSNIQNFSYPTHKCNNKPERPEKPESFSAKDDVEKYNNQIAKYNVRVSEYNESIKKYKACINQYIKNGNNDIKIIREQLNAALKEARSN